MRIYHNIPALNSWRQITQINYRMSKTLERLSSGLRINRAGDDAAGLAISEKMRAQIRGLNMAVKNAQDAISLVQTAEGALNEVHSILQRMRELAVQAASDTNTEVDRAQIQKEIDQLKEEIDRIARTTEFNTKKLLDGKVTPFRSKGELKLVSGGNLGLRVGGEALYTQEISTDGGSISIHIANALFTLSFTSAGSDVVKITVKYGGNNLATFSTNSENYSMDLGDVKLNIEFNSTLNTVTKIDVDYTTSDAGNYNATFIAEVGQFVGNETSPLDVRVVRITDGASSESSVSFSSGIYTLGFSLSTFDSKFVVEGVVLSWDKDAYSIEDFGGSLPESSIVDAGVARLEGATEGKASPLEFLIGANEGQGVLMGIDKMNSKELGVNLVNVTTREGAQRAISIIDAAIFKVSATRATLGAVQNRLEHTIANLGVAAENLTAAESRIRDADMAKEMMQFTKQQILMMSAMSMLAQANAQPQNVLLLMR